MSVKDKILTISYQEMMDCHKPPPTTGDCSDEYLVSDCLRAHLESMDPKPKSIMYETDVSWVSPLGRHDSHSQTDCVRRHSLRQS